MLGYARGFWRLVACLFFLGSFSAPKGSAQTWKRDFIFRDVAPQTRLRQRIEGIQAHAAAWGDVDNDGTLDLFVGSYYRDLRDHETYQTTLEPVPGRVYYNRDGKFVYDPESGVEIKSDCTGAVFVDFDNDGDLDLYVSNYRPKAAGTNQLFENDGTGLFEEITSDDGPCPKDFVSRGIAIFDYDCDGLLDVFIVEGDRPVKRSRLYRNLGEFCFKDVTKKVGLPRNISGLGVGVSDVTGNGWGDIFVAGFKSNRLFVNKKGRFREVSSLRRVFRWESSNTTAADDKPCGVAFGDVNRDGKPDLVIGFHYKAPWRYPERIRLFLNMGMKGRDPVFRHVSGESGLEPLTSRAPHVEVRDFDNDGWLDIYTTIIVKANGRYRPVIYKNLGVRNHLPRFRENVLNEVSYPTKKHREMNVHQIIKNSPVRYFGVGPSSDFDRDGRLDLVLPAWWPSLPSLLLKNVSSPRNNWLCVRVIGTKKVNRMGIGSKVYLYQPGAAGEDESLIGFQEIALAYGYSSSQEAVAHFGLGKLERCNVLVKFPGLQETVVKRDVPAGQTLVIEGP